jgi:hypothetical protein
LFVSFSSSSYVGFPAFVGNEDPPAPAAGLRTSAADG